MKTQWAPSMEYSIKTGSLEKQRCGCLVIGFFEKKKLTPSATTIDQSCNGLISNLLKRGDIKGKVGETLMLNHVADASADRILLVGLGDNQEMEDKDYRKALNNTIKAIKNCGAKNAIVAFMEVSVKHRDSLWKAKQLPEVLETGIYQFTEMKSIKPDNQPLSHIYLGNIEKSQKTSISLGLKQGKAIAEGVRFAKQVANLPGNICTPTYLADKALILGKTSDQLQVKILEESGMKKLGMGALLSVSRGSRQPAKLIVMDYKGGPTKASPIVLVGKGLTFDAGGISLKPAAAMDEMKYDMCGGASVLGAMSAIVELELPINVVGLIPSSENLPDGDANKPGDIVTSMSGQTIEILNTDAEGRLILCDTLTYAERFKPEAVIDIATLTGACVIALGHHPSGLMGNDNSLCEALEQAGDTSSDRVWRMPLWEDYQNQLKSNFADMANIGGRDGGTITAGCFLSRFAKKFKWAHLDIAGTAWKSGSEKGATGRPVPLLVQYLLDRAS